MYNVIPYKLKVMHVKNDILKASSIRKNRNVYPRTPPPGDYSSMVLLHEKHLGDTTIAGNTDLNGNIITEIIDLVLSYLHIGLQTGDKNIVSNQAKQKLLQIPPFKKLLKGLSLVKCWRLLMMKEKFT